MADPIYVLFPAKNFYGTFAHSMQMVLGFMYHCDFADGDHLPEASYTMFGSMMFDRIAPASDTISTRK